MSPPVRPVVVIPAHDEAASLPRVVAELRGKRPDLEIVVVDDGSRDDTTQVLAKLPVRWVRLPVRLGVGGAMRTGLRRALALGADAVVRVDADGQHPPEEIAKLLAAVGDTDVVIGSRYLETPGKGTKRLLAALIGLFAREPVTDPTSGFQAFSLRAARLLAVHHPTGFGEPELRLFLARNGLKTREIAVTMRPREAGRSTFTGTNVAVAALRALLAMVVVPLRRRVEEPE